MADLVLHHSTRHITPPMIYQLTTEEKRLVREGLDQLDRGEVATDAEVRAVFDKYRSTPGQQDIVGK